MDCSEFDEQVVRLEKIKDVADQFVRVRLDEIHHSDINLFEFDYDLTLMVFFLNASEEIYGRYGGRDAEDADSRQSLAGLRYSMQAALQTHKEEDRPKVERKEPLLVRSLQSAGNYRGCIHCHNVKEIQNDELKQLGLWSREKLWRYPMPENIGLALEVDRGNVVKSVGTTSVASSAGLAAGDVVDRIGGLRVRSFADAQTALDRAPDKGQFIVEWLRDGERHSAKLTLNDGWRRTDISWRPSMQRYLAAPRLYGRDLSLEERKTLGLKPKQLAFAHRDRVLTQASEAGIRAGDVILGFDGRELQMTAYDFQTWVRENYILGDRVKINVFRDGKRIDIPMTLEK
ncbi:MAG: Trx7/PDZ domain-containing (seleno)protein [Planctomycetota bacterium]|nr:Trx7/PDZ domain-containing (seleno)protein [Planctomycetota bacterium]MDA1252316.1 Trx7/PDZ domain-containing (seleno)protein [Planctomycetota bacterium]